MLQETNGESAETLESKVQPQVFKDILDKVQFSMDLPTHTAWDGSKVRGTFDELKVSQGQLDDKFLTGLVMSFTDPKIDESKPLVTKTNLTHFLKHQVSPENDGKQNLFAHLHFKLGHFADRPRKLTSLQEINKLERVKTVFCHADFQTDEVSSIFNVQFDQTGKFIISGADDGIIKVWDRETLTLQASLHGHFDYITDMDVSKCNQFIATAGKDAQIIIWELQTGKLIQKIQHHQQLINRIQFFSPKFTKDCKENNQDQFLFTCSDDGTVRLYDFSPFTQKLQVKEVRSQETDQYKVRRSSKQRSTGENIVSQELYSVELTPDDFRPGVRNKKLDTLALNHNGLVVAGSNTGEMFVWRVNYENIVKRLPKQDCHRFLGQFKIHKSSGIQFCEFSPLKGIPCIGDTLMTGSTDGFVKIWRMNMHNWRKDEKDFTMDGFERLILEIDENRGCLLTSKEVTQGPNGDANLGYTQDQVLSQGKIKTNFKTKYLKSQCDAVRWSVNGRFAISSITSQIEKTKEEECHIKIWDTVEQVYYDDLAHHSGQTLKKNTWVLAPHPQYEEILLTGSDGGMLILWNIQQKQILKQFFQNGAYSIDAFVMDNPLDGKWSPDGKAFIVGNQLGTISLYSCETNKVHQYEATRVQQFFQFDIARQQDNPFEKITDRPQICGYNMVPYEVQPSKPLIRFPPESLSSTQFERRLLLGKELGKMEEKYYEDQILNSQNGTLLDQQLGRIESFQESAIQPDVMLDADMEDVSILNDLSPQRPIRRPRAQHTPRSSARAPQATRSRFQPSRVQPQVQQHAEPIVLSGLYDEDDQDVPRRRNKSDSDEEIEFSNVDQSNKEDEDSDSNSSSDSNESLSNYGKKNLRRVITRVTRHNVQERPNRRVRESSNEEEQINTRTRKRVPIEESSIESFESSDEEVKMRTNQGRTERNEKNHQSGRHLVKNNGRNSRVLWEDETSGNEKLNQKKNQSGKTTRNKQIIDESFEIESPQVNRKIGNSSYLSDHAINANHEPGQIIPSMLIQAKKFMKGKCETSYDLVENAVADSICYLCDRKDPPLAGPFQKKGCSQANYFHKECLETNTYSYYKVQEKKWVNIESMLKHLKEDAQYQCFRCLKTGASVSCFTCGRNFHGFQCAMLYMISLGATEGIGSNCEGVNPYHWQCLFCRNTENYEIYENSEVKNQKAYLQKLKKIDKSHLHRATQHMIDQRSSNKIITTYVPQVDDIVYYFFQGHENYIYQHSCHFFAGQTQNFPIQETMPWLQHNNNFKDKQMVLCRVTSVQTLYPSHRSIELIAQFGKESTDVVQTPQMIQRIRLQIINQEKDLKSGNVFTLEIFPNELPDFLVLEHVYKHQLDHFQKLKSKNVKIKTKKGIEELKIVQTSSPLEPSLAPNSVWLNIVCSKQVVPIMNPQHRSGRNAAAILPENLIRINFWDIVFDQPVPEFNAFSNIEHLKLFQALQVFMNKKKDYLIYFKERVKEDIAKDYRVIIPQEMWFDLLRSRLENCYYRSQASLMADLHQISINAQLYNGEQHEIAVDAEQVVQKVKMEMLKFIDQVGDVQIRERVQEAGKLTAPSRMLKNDAEIQNQYDQLRPTRQAQNTRINTLIQPLNSKTEESKEPQFEQSANESRLGKRKQSKPELAEVAKVASSQEENINGENSGRLLKNKRQRVI